MLDQLKPIEQPRLKDDFVKQVEHLILSGELVTDTKLPPERELAAQLGISRPVVHEGLTDLAARGLIRLQPRHGWRVNDYRSCGSVEMINTLFHYREGSLQPRIAESMEELRIIIETDTVKKWIRNPERERICKELEQLITESPANGSAEKAAEEDFRFHHRFMLHSENLLYPLLLNSMKEVYLNLLTRFFSTPGRWEQVRSLKKALLEQLRKGDETKAIEAILHLSSHTAYEEENHA